jgi:transposase
MPFKKKVNNDLEAAKEAAMQERTLKRALHLNDLGMSNASIARDIGVHPATIRRWFRNNGIPAKERPNMLAKLEPVEVDEEKDELKEELQEHLMKVTTSAITQSKLDASLQEDVVLADIADAQSSPADKYQHYIAAAGIKLLRDSMRGLKPAKTIRELSELDQLIRRNLGLNAKTGGGTSKLSIDISILNNGAADKGNGTVKSMRSQIIDAESADDPEE